MDVAAVGEAPVDGAPVDESFEDGSLNKYR